MVLTIITSSKPNLLSKTFSLSSSGSLQTQTGGQLTEGEYNVYDYKTITEFADLLPTLQKNQALSYGRPNAISGILLSKKTKAERNDRLAITRSREYFDWHSGPAIFFGDYDPQPGTEPLTPEALRLILCRIVPELNGAPMVLWHSASSHIYHKETGDVLKGNGGVRIYIAVVDGRDIPRFGDLLFKRLWLNGYGNYICSKSGALLSRSLLDASVWQPERLDFAAGAFIDENQQIEQRRPNPQVINPEAPPFNTSLIPDLAKDEEIQLSAIQVAERNRIRPQQGIVRSAWIDERIRAIEDKEEREQKRSILEEAIINRKLFADFELIKSDNTKITVGEILDNPKYWHNQYLKDPMEPEYNGGANVSWLNLRSGGKPSLYSHAHGGANYTLLRQTTTLQIAGGELPRILVETSAIISITGEVYQRGGMLVRIADKEILPVTQPWIKNHIEENIKFTKWDARSKKNKPIDSPTELANRYLNNRGAWLEPELTGIINAPLFRLDGTLLDTPGYDSKTGLLLRGQNEIQFPHVPLNPNHQQLTGAFQTLWEPFQFFPFVSPDDAAGALAAMLTAIQRPILPTAPAFGFNAHVAGSGKSYLAKAISWLSGNEPSEMPWSSEAEEQRKRLTAALIYGQSSILIDNINGMLDSDALCSILTGECYQDRRLGVSENIKLSTQTLFLITGNNVTVIKDLWRRVIVSTIDHRTEKPSKLSFPFNPVFRVRENWQKYRAAGLIILSAYIAAGSPRISKDTVGSFEDWDNKIRQCVLWLDQLEYCTLYSVPKLGDPIKLLEQSYASDPELERLEQFIMGWYGRYQNQEKTLAYVLNDIETRHCTLVNSTLSHELLSDISGGNNPNSRAIAAFMRRNKGRIVNGYILNSGRVCGSRTTWFVQKRDL